jgi:hypothetical protein
MCYLVGMPCPTNRHTVHVFLDPRFASIARVFARFEGKALSGFLSDRADALVASGKAPVWTEPAAGRTEKVRAYLTPSTHAALRELAHRLGTSQSSLLAGAVEDHITKQALADGPLLAEERARRAALTATP